MAFLRELKFAGIDRLQGQVLLCPLLVWSDSKATGMIVISLLEAKSARGAMRDEHPDSFAYREWWLGLPNRRSSSSSSLFDHRSILLRPPRIPEADDKV